MQSLHLIDNYLADLSDKAAIQEVLDLVKPFFYTQMMTKLQETSSALAKMLTVDDTHNIVLLFFYLNKIYPGMEKSGALNKIYGYSQKQQTQELLQASIPVLSASFKERDMLNRWIVPDTLNDWKNRTLEDKAAQSMKTT